MGTVSDVALKLFRRPPNMGIIDIHASECLSQLEYIVPVAAAWAMAGGHIIGDILVASGAEEMRVGLGGSVCDALRPWSTVFVVETESKPLVARLFTNIELP